MMLGADLYRDEAAGRMLTGLLDIAARTRYGPLPFEPSTDMMATNRMRAIGLDPANNRVFGRDGQAGNLALSDDWGTTWTLTMGLPTGTRYTGALQMVRWGDWYYLTVDSTDGTQWFLYRCPAISAAEGPYVWEAEPLFTFRAGTNNLTQCNLASTSAGVFVAEYGNPGPEGGPRIYRAPDGVTFSQVYVDPPAKHVHAVIEDPYNPGHIYSAIGDNQTSNSLIRSLDGGTTWDTYVESVTNKWQAVQVSFDAQWIYLALDRVGATFAAVDRSSGQPIVGSSNWHYNLSVAGAAASTDRYYQIAYYGAVDPDTGVYYCSANDQSVPGNIHGIFMCDQLGGTLVTRDAVVPLSGRVYVGGGYVFVGTRRFPAATFA